MRTLFISHDAHRAGAQIFLLNLLRGLKDTPSEHFAVLLRSGGALQAAFENICPVWRVDHRRFVERLLWRPRGVRRHGGVPVSALAARVGRELAPDLVYSNTITNADVLPAVRSLGVPVLTHVHELEPTIRRRLGESGFRTVDACTDVYIAVSAAVRDNLVRNWHVDERRIRVVHGFVPAIDDPEGVEARARETFRRQHGIPGDAFVVGACGTTDWRKGPDLFVQLARAVGRRDRARRWFFAWLGGDAGGEHVDELLYDARQAGIGGELRFLGTHADPRPFFAAIDLFALVSREDPFPLVALEAAMFAKPAVCFRGAGGLPEFVDAGCGVAVPYLDVEAMAEAVAALARDDQRRATLGLAARRRALERHSAGVKIAEMLDIMHRVAARQPLPAG